MSSDNPQENGSLGIQNETEQINSEEESIKIGKSIFEYISLFKDALYKPVEFRIDNLHGVAHKDPTLVSEYLNTYTGKRATQIFAQHLFNTICIIGIAGRLPAVPDPLFGIIYLSADGFMKGMEYYLGDHKDFLRTIYSEEYSKVLRWMEQDLTGEFAKENWHYTNIYSVIGRMILSIRKNAKY